MLGFARLRALRPDPWLVVGAIAVYLVFGAPVLASGTPSLAGYLALPDTGHQLALAQLLADRGPDWPSLQMGSTHDGVAPYFLGHYPIAAQALLGVTAPLGIIDLAWLYQPLLSFAALLLFLGLAALVAPLLRRRWQTALVAFAAAQSALVLGYALQGSIKELAFIALLACIAALATAVIRERRPARSVIVLAIAASAALSTLGPAALPFIFVPGLAVLVVFGIRLARERSGRELAWLIAAAAIAVLLALPVLSSLSTQIEVNGATLDAGVDRSQFGAAGDLGNLAAPLELVQTLGVWLSGDYRYHTLEPTLETLQQIALWTTGVLALLGLAWALRAARARPAAAGRRRAAVDLPAASRRAVRGRQGDDARLARDPAARDARRHDALDGPLASAQPRRDGRAARRRSLAPARSPITTCRSRRTTASRRCCRSTGAWTGAGRCCSTSTTSSRSTSCRRVQPFNEPESDHVYRTAPYSPNALSDPLRRPSIKTPVDIDDLTLSLHQALPVHHPAPVADRQPPAGELPARSGSATYYELWQRTRHAARPAPRAARARRPASRRGRSRQRGAQPWRRARDGSAVRSPTCRARGWRCSTSATIRGRRAGVASAASPAAS